MSIPLPRKGKQRYEIVEHNNHITKFSIIDCILIVPYIKKKDKPKKKEEKKRKAKKNEEKHRYRTINYDTFKCTQNLHDMLYILKYKYELIVLNVILFYQYIVIRVFY